MRVPVESIERFAVLEKEDWQRKVNQAVQKDDLKQGVFALGGMEGVERFLYVLKQEGQREEIREAESRRVTERIRSVSVLKRRGGAR